MLKDWVMLKDWAILRFSSVCLIGLVVPGAGYWRIGRDLLSNDTACGEALVS